MAIKDYWVYQKRDSLKPWVLYIVKEYDKRAGTRATCLDATFYHEDVPNGIHAKSEVCIHHDTLQGYVKHFADMIAEYAYVTLDDEKQLADELSKILI